MMTAEEMSKFYNIPLDVEGVKFKNTKVFPTDGCSFCPTQMPHNDKVYNATGWALTRDNAYCPGCLAKNPPTDEAYLVWEESKTNLVTQVF